MSKLTIQFGILNVSSRPLTFQFAQRCRKKKHGWFFLQTLKSACVVKMSSVDMVHLSKIVNNRFGCALLQNCSQTPRSVGLFQTLQILHALAKTFVRDSFAQMDVDFSLCCKDILQFLGVFTCCFWLVKTACCMYIQAEDSWQELQNVTHAFTPDG